ncbi:MAG: serine/threonine-protein kinase [Acidimicrobiia bacterium]
MSDSSAPSDEPKRDLVPGEPRSFGAGRYVVQRRLGAGNFATVYLAFDERLDVPVAVKLLSDRWSWEPEVRARFVQEARLLRSINDPHVVQIRDIAETEDGRPYLVMDYASRGTLEQRLIELAQRQLRPDANELRRVATAVADAVAVLHERRIAHRDIKPSNLLITADDRRSTVGNGASIEVATSDARVIRDGERIMLGDLGLAKDLAFDSGITVGVGTAGYMAPEQTLPGAKIDTRTDIYAVSALMAQVASGEAPDPLRRYSDGRIEGGRPLPVSIPESLAAVLRRGLDSDPDRRIANIEQWRGEVDASLSDDANQLPTPTSFGSIAVPVPVTDASPRAIDRRSTRLLATAAAGTLAVLAIVIAVIVNGRGSGSASSTTTSTATTNATDTTVAASTSAAQANGSTVASAVTFSTTIGSTTSATNPPPATTSPPVEPTSAPAPTAPPATVAPTVPPTVPATTAAPTLSVKLVGPTEVQRGVDTAWTVEAPLAVSGTWSLTGPVQINPGQDGWLPGNYFRGTWNVASTNTLSLTVVDAAGNSATASITFTVT